jgi:hypothetical protein
VPGGFPVKKYLSILALLACCAAASRAQVTISPAPGTYSGTQSVSMSCNPSNSTTIWYTTNGYPANTAAAMYTGPIQVSATTTINAICATTAEVDGEPGYDAEVNPQNYYDPPNGSWKCNVNNPPIESNNGEFDCTTSGGVSGVIYQWNFTEGSGSSPASLLVETQSSDPSNSMLFVYTPKTECDSCSTIAQHLVVEPTEGTAAIPNNEMDMEQCTRQACNAREDTGISIPRLWLRRIRRTKRNGSPQTFPAAFRPRSIPTWFMRPSG